MFERWQIFWKIVNKQLKNVNKFLKIEKNLPPLKYNLALPTLGQICTVTELQSFENSTFQMKHPVANNFLSYCNKHCNNWDLLNDCNSFTCNNEFQIIAIKLSRNKFAITLQYFLEEILVHQSCKYQSLILKKLLKL